MKKIGFRIKIEYNESLSDLFDDDGGQEELALEAKSFLENYIVEECIGVQNRDKLKITAIY